MTDRDEPCTVRGRVDEPLRSALDVKGDRAERLRYLTEQELLALRLCSPEAIGLLMRREGFDPEVDSLETYARHKAAHVLTVALLTEGDADGALEMAGLPAEEG